jgi:ZIP family zinc transporter
MQAAEVIGMLGAGMATGIGACAVFALRRPSQQTLDVLLGFTAGIMLAATMFSLLVPAIDRGSYLSVVAGFTVGGMFILALDRFVPHIHERFHERGEGNSDSRRRSFMIVAALAIHNIPEGMAVGVAFAAGGPGLGVPIALAIGIQNIPEGFAAAAPLLTAGVSRRKAAAIGILTGAIEPVAAFVAFAAVSVFGTLLAPALAFAAAAMLYVVVDELIPESHARGFERPVTVALFAGFIVMMTLDNVLA